MTAQVTATPGGTTIHSSGSVIVAQAGVGYQIADVAPDGTVGPALTPPELVLAVNDPNLGDISVTLPDGTVLVFQGMIAQFGLGGGFAGADGSLVVASLEDAVDAAAGGGTGGPAGGGGPDAGGSSQAFNPTDLGPLGTDFGSAEDGDGVGDDGAGGGDDDDDPGDVEDPNLILTTPTTTVAANSPPNAVDDVGATDEDNPVAVPVITGVLSNDTDPDGDPLTITAVNGNPANVGNQFALPSGALLTLNANGSYNYNPNGQFETLSVGQTGTDTFTYTISDGNGGVDTATVTINIAGVNDPPVAQDDTLAIAETEVEVSAVAPDFNLLADNGNGADTDIDAADVLTVSAVGAPVLNGFAAAGVNVTNVPAFGAGPPFMATIEVDGGATTAILTVNADGTANLVAGVGDPFAALGNGQSGTIAFQYTIDDGNTGTAMATATITVNGVNDAPDAQDDALAITETEVELNAAAPDFNLFADNGNGADTDAEGDAFTVTAVGPLTLNGFAAAGVTVTNVPAFGAGPPFMATIEIDAGSATAILTVNADGTANLVAGLGDPFAALGVAESGTIAFQYTIDDGNTGTDMATATITVNGANDAPVAQNDALAITETEVENSTTAPDFNLFADNASGADLDVDGDTFTVSQVGAIALNGFVAAGVNVTNVPAFGAGPPFTATIEIDGGTSTALLTVNADGTANLVAGAGDPFAALGTGQSGTIAFPYTIDDGNTGTSTATATITVNGVNDAPVAQDDCFNTDEDMVLNAGNNVGNLITNAAGMDSDVDGDPLMIQTVENLTFENFPASLNPIVGAIADPPLAGVFQGTIGTNSGGALLTVFADGNVILETSLNDPFGPMLPNETGTISFQYTLTDGTVTTTANAVIKVAGIAVPPVLDLDGDDSSNPPTVGGFATTFTEAGDGPPANVGSGPVPIGDVDVTITDGDSTMLQGATITLTNPETGDVMSIDGVLPAGINGVVNNAVVTLTGAATLADYQTAIEQIRFAATGDTPVAGTRTVEVVVTDESGTASNTATATIDVVATNDLPTAQDDPFTATDEDAILDAGAGGLTVGNVFVDNGNGPDTDPENDDLDVGNVNNIQTNGLPAGTVVSGVTETPTEFSFTLTNGGSVATVTVDKESGDTTVTPTTGDLFGPLRDGDVATIEFDYQANDGTGDAPAATATITVNGITDVIFIDNSVAGGPGTGTQTDPFRSIAEFNASNTPGPGDIIFIRTGTGTYSEADGINLQDDQILLGQERADLLPVTVVGETVGTAPVIEVTGAGNNGIDLASGNTVRGLDIGNTTGAGIDDGGGSVGALTISDVAIGGNGKAFDVDQGGTLNVTLESVTSTNSGSEGIDINGVGGTFTVSGVTSVTGSGGTGIQIQNATGGSAFNFSGAVTANTGTNTGIDLGNNAGGTAFNFTNSVDVDTTTGTGVNITGNNAASAFNFTNGGLDIDTAGGTGLNATADGTLVISGTGNSVSSVGGTAININGVTIGATGLTFQSVSASGATNGIVLNNTGAGGFTVTGTGTLGGTLNGNNDGSGGTIQNMTGDAISLTNTGPVMLDFLQVGANGALSNIDMSGIRASGVNGLTVRNTNFINASGDDAGGGNDFAAIRVLNPIAGSDVTLLNNLFNRSFEDHVRIENDAPGGGVAMGTITVSQNNFDNNDDSGQGNDAFNYTGDNGSNATINITSNRFFNSDGDHIQVALNGSASATVNIGGPNAADGNELTANNGQVLGSGITLSSGAGSGGIPFSGLLNFLIQNNDIQDATAQSINVNLSTSSTAGLRYSGTISDNTIGTAGDSGSGGAIGIGVTTNGNGTINVDIDNNTINAWDSANGITLTARDGSGRLESNVTNNVVGQADPVSANNESAIEIASGAVGADASVVLVNITGNSFDLNPDPQFGDLFLGVLANGQIQLTNYVGAANSQAAIQTFIQANNTGTPTVQVFAGGAGQIVGGAAVPLTAAAGEAVGSTVQAPLDLATLAPIVEEAIARWEAAGLNQAEMNLLSRVEVGIADFNNGLLGNSLLTTVLIDDDAAGHGWFIDQTPDDDSEFSQGPGTSDLIAGAGEASQGIDLLTVVMHELGHVLGLDHEEDGLLAATLEAGVRRLPEQEHGPAEALVALAADDLLEPANENAALDGLDGGSEDNGGTPANGPSPVDPLALPVEGPPAGYDDDSPDSAIVA